jgi:hypothetical protein
VPLRKRTFAGLALGKLRFQRELRSNQFRLCQAVPFRNRAREFVP